MNLASSSVHNGRRGGFDPESLPTRIEVLARTVCRDVLGAQSPAPADALCNQFVIFVAEKCVKALSLGSLQPVEGGLSWHLKSWRSRLTGGCRPMLDTEYQYAKDDRRLRPIMEAFESEPAGSSYSLEALWGEVVSHIAERIEAGEDLRNLSSISHSAAEPLHAFAGYRRQSDLALSCRVVFRTGGGLLLGTGPADTQPGDEVWVLSGADTPVVLRPSPRSHRFLGEAYVYGMMHGQALKQFPTLYNLVLE